MKRKTIFLTLIFTFVIALIMFLPSETNATVTLDRVINIDGTNLVPRIGEEPGLLSDTEYYEIVSQTWGEESNLSGMTGKFEEGKNYTFNLTIKPKEGYEFSSDVYFNFSNIKWTEDGHGVSSKDGTAFFTGKCTAVKTHKLTVTSDDGATVTPNGTMDIYTGYSKEILIILNKGYAIESVKVNGGETFSTSDISINENGDYVLTVTCDEDKDINVVIKIRKGIETVKVTGATVPKIGELPVTDGLKVPDSANYKIVNAVWGTYSSADGPFISFKEIKANEKFVKGKEYALQVTLQSLDESIFFDRTMIYINGIDTHGLIGGSEAIAYLTFEELKENYFLNNTDEQKFTIGTDKTITFNVDAPFFYVAEGGKIFVDGEEILETNYYDYSPGVDNTTEITLKEEYMKTLKLGKHTIKFVFYNGIEAETTFTIIDSKQSGGNKDNTTDNNSTDIDTPNGETTNNTPNVETNNPPTGDNIMLYVLILGIATIGIIVTTRLRKNN